MNISAFLCNKFYKNTLSNNGKPTNKCLGCVSLIKEEEMKSKITEIMMAVATQDTQFRSLILNNGVADSRKSGGIISIFDSNL